MIRLAYDKDLTDDQWQILSYFSLVMTDILNPKHSLREGLGFIQVN